MIDCGILISLAALAKHGYVFADAEHSECLPPLQGGVREGFLSLTSLQHFSDLTKFRISFYFFQISLRLPRRITPMRHAVSPNFASCRITLSAKVGRTTSTKPTPILKTSYISSISTPAC